MGFICAVWGMDDLNKLVQDTIDKYQDAYLQQRLLTNGKEGIAFEEFIKEHAEFRQTISQKALEDAKSPYTVIFESLSEEQKKISGPLFKEQAAISEQRFKQKLESGEFSFVMQYVQQYGTAGDAADIIYAINQELLHGIADIHQIHASLRGYMGRSTPGEHGRVDLEAVLTQIPAVAFERSASLENIFYNIETRRYFENINTAVQNKELRTNPTEYNKAISRALDSVIEQLQTEISDTKDSRARKIKQRVKENYEELKDFSLETAVSELNGKVFPNIYQKIGIKLVHDSKRVLIADEMGTGKTAQAILGALYVEKKTGKQVKTLIVAPNSVKQTIKAELFKYIPSLKEEDVVIINGGNREESLRKAKDARFAIINYELVHRTEWREDDLEETEITKSDLEGAKKSIDRLAKHQQLDEAAQKLFRKESRGKLNGTTFSTLEETTEAIAKIRKLEEDTALVAKLNNLGFNYVVLDEVHNAKNLERYTTKSIRKLAANTEYLVLLSGTPVPNGMQDLEVTFELLGIHDLEKIKEKVRKQNNLPADKEISVPFIDCYEADPRLIRDFLRRHMLRRRSDRVLDLPALNVINREITLDYSHRQIYQAILDNEELSHVNKIIALRKCLLDPKLLLQGSTDALEHRPDLLELIKQGVPSHKYKTLEQELEQTDGDKTIIFTSLFKEGVTTYLETQLKDKYKALRIDGDVSDDIKEWKATHTEEFCKLHKVKQENVEEIVQKAGGNISEREIIRRLFMNYQDYKILIATTRTMKEGVSLTAANNVIFIDKPYTFAEFEQSYKRAHREGQTKPVKVISLLANDAIDVGIENLLREKRRLGELIIDGAPLRPEEKELLDDKTKTPKPVKQYLKPQDEILLRLYGALHCAGARKAKEILHDDKLASELYADNYLDNPYAIHTAHLVKEILGKTNASTERILDLAAGYGYTAKVLGKPTVNLDINPNMLKRAKQLTPESTNVVGLMQEMPFRPGTFDTAVYSLAFHYASAEERAGILEQINKVMDKKGTFILTVPTSRIDKKGAENLERKLAEQGFRTNNELTGFVRNKLDNFDVFVYVGTKAADKKTVLEPIVLTQKEVVIEKVPQEYHKRKITPSEKKINTDFRYYKKKGKKGTLPYQNPPFEKPRGTAQAKEQPIFYSGKRKLLVSKDGTVGFADDN